MKQIRVGASPLTGTIFAGALLKDGRTWAANKQDVTDDALFAVAMHVKKHGGSVELREEGLPIYKITVEQL
jgi:hypothetical protein